MHQPLTEIIIPVYNGLNLTKQCIDSLFKYTRSGTFKATIIDNGSDNYVTAALYSLQRPGLKVVSLDENVGFAKAINIYLNKYWDGYSHICLLNNDVFVTKDWLAKMHRVLESDPRARMVVPLTNHTGFANFPLVSGWNYHQLNAYLEKLKLDPIEIIPSGFCFLFPKKLIDEIGKFDESFDFYGEDTDFWFRAIKAETKDHQKKFYKALLDPTTYVFHIGGATSGVLDKTRQKAQELFIEKHPDFPTWNRTSHLKYYRFIEKIKPPIEASEWSVIWVVTTMEPCGGTKYIVDLVNGLIEKGIDAKVVILTTDSDQVISHPLLRTGLICIDPRSNFLETFYTHVAKSGIIFSHTENKIHLRLLNELAKSPFYKVYRHYQSYGPDLNQQTYILPTEFPVVSASQYVTNRLKNNVKITIEPGVDTDVFFDKGKKREPYSLCIISNPLYWFKGQSRTKQIVQELEKLAEQRHMHFNVYIVGLNQLENTHARCMGFMREEKFADLLNKVQLFIDPSYYHSYGLPCLEALRCGCDVLCWDNGGSTASPDYNHERLTILEKGADIQEAVKWVLERWEELNENKVRIDPRVSFLD